MNILCMDTSYKFLTLGVLKDGKVCAGSQKECWKRQSEELFPELECLMKEAGLTTEEIDGIVITEGPGSYTGVRIAMTVAKVFCAMGNVPLYTIGTLRLYAGNEEQCRVLLDARGGRAYTAVYDHGNEIEAPHISTCEELSQQAVGEHIIGEGHLIGSEDSWPDLVQRFADCSGSWVKAENVHLVVPEYLKANDAYLVKK